MARTAKPAIAGATGKAPRRAPAADRQPLTRKRILDAALAMIDRDGLAGFSLRSLGTALSCEPMSVYHYFPNKAHLLDGLVDAALATVVTQPAGNDPIERLRQLGRSYRALAHRYPKLYPLIAVHRFFNTPAGVRLIEEVLELVYEAVGDDRLAAQFFRVLGFYLTGAALDETAGYARGPSAAEPATDSYVAENCPRLAAAAPYFKPAWWDDTFELGLDGVLAAMRAAAAERSAGPARSAIPKPIIRPKR